MTIEKTIAKLGSRQYGLVELGQLAAVGVRRHHVDRRLASGHLERVRPGVFIIAGVPPTFEQAVLAAVLAAGPHAVVSHTTAAEIWGLPFIETDAIELTTFRPHWARMPGVRAHRTIAFLACEHTVRRRIPLTTVARTLVDLSGSFSVAQLGRMADRALRKGTLRLEDLRKCVTGLAPAPGRHPSRIMGVLRRRLRGYEPGESDLEMRFVRGLVAAGLPEPVLQHRITLGKRRCRIDLSYPESEIAIEVDSWEYYGTRSAFDDDRARANDLVVAGWRVFRFTSTMTNEQAAAMVRAALSQKHSA